MNLKIITLAQDINRNCINYNYFCAIGLLKETLNLWDNNTQYLHPIAITFLKHLRGIK